MWAAVVAIVIGQAAPATAARPNECDASVSRANARANAWERAKQPALRRYCALVASGVTKLAGGDAQASNVVELAQEADRLLPGHAAPKILEGRAELARGRPKEAVASFEEASGRDVHALDEPVALLAWARANAQLGRRERAAAAYRDLLPRSSVLAPSVRGAACFEASIVASTLGPAALEDTVAMARQAVRETRDALRTASVVALALALDRGGHTDEARALLASEPPSLLASGLRDVKVTEELSMTGTAFEKDALEAFALDASRPALAREAWKRYLEGPGGQGPWSAHARARAAGQGKAPPRSPRETGR